MVIDLPLQREHSFAEEETEGNKPRGVASQNCCIHDLRIGMSRRTPAQQGGEGSSYANRVPRRQWLYDWAPGSDDEDLYRELLSRANIPTFAQSARSESTHRNFDYHGSSRRSMRRAWDEATDRPSSWAEATRTRDSPPRTDASASTAALLQSVEQHRRFNARARSTLQSYILDRDRRNNDPTPSAATWSRLHQSERRTAVSPYPAGRDLPSQPQLRDEYRQLSLENASIATLRNSMRYLSKLRGCDTLEEGLALATRMAMDDACMRRQDRRVHRFTSLSDLIVDTSTLPAVAECSWLTPGTIFTGSQHTPREPRPIMPNRDHDHNSHRQPHPPPERYHLDRQQAAQERQRRRAYTRVSTYRDRLPVPETATQHNSQNANSDAQQPSPHPYAQSDHWPVTVTLHDISLPDQTLSGTMSATHIPNKSSPHTSLHNAQESSMRSFFEGEIIDFKTHSLETENFCTGVEDGDAGPGGVRTDARYWRGIGPFRELLHRERARKGPEKAGRFGNTEGGWGADEGMPHDNDGDDVVEDAIGGEGIIASHLRSRSWIENVLLKEWVLMRWKERCFIHDPTKTTSDASAATTDSSARSQSGRGNSATPDPSTWGLTISGFYYVALRRQTGEIEGLYYDPGSLPFQILELRPEGGRIGTKRAWPAQQFR